MPIWRSFSIALRRHNPDCYNMDNQIMWKIKFICFSFLLISCFAAPVQLMSQTKPAKGFVFQQNSPLRLRQPEQKPQDSCSPDGDSCSPVSPRQSGLIPANPGIAGSQRNLPLNYTKKQEAVSSSAAAETSPLQAIQPEDSSQTAKKADSGGLRLLLAGALAGILAGAIILIVLKRRKKL